MITSCSVEAQRRVSSAPIIAYSSPQIKYTDRVFFFPFLRRDIQIQTRRVDGYQPVLNSAFGTNVKKIIITADEITARQYNEDIIGFAVGNPFIISPSLVFLTRYLRIINIS